MSSDVVEGREAEYAREDLLSVGKDNFLSSQIDGIGRRQSRQHLIYLLAFLAFGVFLGALAVAVFSRFGELHASFEQKINAATAVSARDIRQDIASTHDDGVSLSRTILTRLSGLEKRLEALSSDIERRDTGIQAALGRIGKDLERGLSEQRQRIDEIEAQIKALDNRIAELKKIFEAVKKDLSQLDTTVGQRVGALAADFDRRVRALDDGLDEIRGAVRAGAAEQKKISDIGTKTGTILTQLSQVAETLGTMQKDVHYLKSRR